MLLVSPLLKSSLFRLSVLAIRLPTFTCAVAPNRMPAPLSKVMLPLLVKAPKMALGAAPRSMRLRALLSALGSWKCTLLSAPMSKLCHW